MNQQQALTKIKAIIGPKTAYRIDEKALTGEKREAAVEAAKAAIAAKRDAVAALEARRLAVLAGNAEYQRLRQAAADANKAADAAQHAALARRITVGRNESLWFSVQADGDTWSEVVEKLLEKKGGAK